MVPVSCLLLFIFSHLFLLCFAKEENIFNPRCPPFPCGILGQIAFPFSNKTNPECGLFIVDDCYEQAQKIQLGKDGPWFHIFGISQDNTIWLSDLQSQPSKKYPNNQSCELIKNLTLPSSAFFSFEIADNQNLFKCPPTRYNISQNFYLLCNYSKYSIYYNHADYASRGDADKRRSGTVPPHCSQIHPFSNKTRNSVEFLNVFTGTFFLKVRVEEECSECHYRGGECLSDNKGNFYCSKGQPEENRFNPRCPPFPCGKLGQTAFMSTNRTNPECGLFIVDDCKKRLPKIRLGKDGPWFHISSISKDDTIQLYDPQFQPFRKYPNNQSCELIKNLTLPTSPFFSFGIAVNQTLFKCHHTHYNISHNFSLLCNYSKYSIYRYFSYYASPGDADNTPLPTVPPHCSQIHVLSSKTRNRGNCLSDSKGKFHCSKANTGNGTLNLKLLLVLGASGSGICILIILAFCFRKKFSSDNSMLYWKNTTESCQNIENFLRNYGSLAPKRYSYSDIKKMTNCFKHKLGQGGYGVVYRGKLLDGRHIAVKVLNESKGNGEEFNNEIASISRTSHVNIVSLLGFCFEGRRRALIYEFVPNGSLEKLIYEKDAWNTNRNLNWETLYRIAVGIARGLEYLHRGCNTRILHFDIKPHNILLDEDFCPKISDFGLAKICPRKESIMSITGARGTVGYMAPEVFCRNFGNISHKSDVYSYGMMVFEMTGRKNNDVGVNGSSDVYFPHWVYKSLETDEELVLQGIENEEDKEYAKKMMIVSLWCIQTIPLNRPTISRVVEMLEGSLDSLQIPPKPFLSSEGISQVDSSTIQTMLTL